MKISENEAEFDFACPFCLRTVKYHRTKTQITLDHAKPSCPQYHMMSAEEYIRRVTEIRSENN